MTEAGATGSGLSGYIDRAGAWAIEPSFAMAEGFCEGLAAVVPANGPGLWGYIDHKGGMVIKPAFQMAGSFMPGE